MAFRHANFLELSGDFASAQFLELSGDFAMSTAHRFSGDFRGFLAMCFSAATCEVGLRCVGCAFLALTLEVDLRCVVRVFLAPTLGVNDFDMILAPRYAAIFAVRNNLTTDIPHYVPHQWRVLHGPLSS